jgi:hypothetical protein
MGSLAAGGAATLGTGAFTTVEAERSVSISVANDTNAYLGLDPVDDAPGNEYVSLSGGTLELSITNNGEGAGVNKNAVTEFTDLFTVTRVLSKSYGTSHTTPLTDRRASRMSRGLPETRQTRADSKTWSFLFQMTMTQRSSTSRRGAQPTVAV